jgi:transcriptional regulator with XRE-family HTH domain
MQSLSLGDFLRKQRLDLGLTQTQVAGEIGTSSSNIRNWEANRWGVSLRFRKRVFTLNGPRNYKHTFKTMEMETSSN